MNARSTTPARPAESSRVPTLICHCERPSTGSGRAGISMRLNTRRRTAVATTTGLPRYARNDKVDTHTATGLPRYARNDKVDAHTATGLSRYVRNDKLDTHTTTGLPRYAHNDKLDTHTATGLPRYARNDKVDTQGQLSPVCWHRRRGGAAGLFGLQSFVTIPAHERYGWRTATY